MMRGRACAPGAMFADVRPAVAGEWLGDQDMAEETGAIGPAGDTTGPETDTTPTIVPIPAGGQEIVIQVSPGQAINLQVIETAAVTLVAEGDDLRIDFGAAGSILLQDFLSAAATDTPPVLLVGGEVQIPVDAIVAALEGDGMLEPAAGDGTAGPPLPGTGANFTPVGLLDPTATETSVLVPDGTLPTRGAFAVEALLGPTGLTFTTPGDEPQFLGLNLTPLDGDDAEVAGDIDTPGDGIVSPAPPAPVTPPTATLSLTPVAGGAGLNIAEDTQGAIAVTAQSGNDGALTQIVITGLDPAWTFDLSGLQVGGATASLNAAGDTLTISGLSGTAYAGVLIARPPADSDVDLGTLNGTVTAVSTVDPTLAATATDLLGVTVEAVADAPVVTAPPTVGNEDSDIPLNIGRALTDIDGSESLTSVVTIGGVPAGATLSAGTLNPDGTWTLTPAQLVGLTVRPPADSDEDFQLTVTATSREAANGDEASTTATLDVTVVAVADTPTVTTAPAAGDEGDAIPLDIDASLADTDGSEDLTITISGVPDDATLSAGTNQGGGVWVLTPGQLTGLTITPGSGDDFTLTVAATAEEDANGDQATVTEPLVVTVADINDPPVNDLPPDQTVLEDYLLVFSSNANSVDHANKIKVTDPITISDEDSGTGDLVTTVSVDTGTLTANALATPESANYALTVNSASSITVTGTVADINATLDGLGYRGPVDQGANATLTIVTDDQGNTGAGGPLTDTDTVDITVVPDADQPTVSLQVLDGGGNPNTEIIPNETVILRITARFDVDDFGDFSDTSEAHTVTVTMPKDYTFVGDTAVTARIRNIDEPTPTLDGSAILTLWTGQSGITQNGIFDYEITLTAPNSIAEGTESFTATATAVEGSNGDTATATETETVTTTTPADIPAPVDDEINIGAKLSTTGNLTTNDASGSDGWADQETGGAQNRIVQIKNESGDIFTLAAPNGAIVVDPTTLDITTPEGGTLRVNFENGDYTYTAPDVIDDGFERFNYTVQDNNGDLGNADLEIFITDPILVDTESSTSILNATNTNDYIIGDLSVAEISTADDIRAFAPSNTGVDGNDFVFADVPNTQPLVDALLAGNDPQGVFAGSVDLTGVTPGWDVFDSLLNDDMLGANWTETNLKAYISDSDNWDDLNDPDNGSLLDIVNGGPGDDVIWGGGGGLFGNKIIGGPGNDTMFGGNTKDTFVWESGDDDSTDEIRGFQIDHTVTNDDVIDLSDLLVGFSGNAIDMKNFVSLDTSGTDATFTVDTDGVAGGDTVSIALKDVSKTDLVNDLNLAASVSNDDIVTAMATQGNLIA